MPQPKRFRNDEWLILTQKVWSVSSEKFSTKENVVIQRFIQEAHAFVEAVQEKRTESSEQ